MSEPTLVLTHGAGGDIDAHDLQVLASSMPAHGYRVELVRMPWRVAGKKLAPAPPKIDEAFVAEVEALGPTGPVILGGRSAGARSACRLARQLGAVGVLALSFPLHPPGRPEKSRLAELTAAGVPTLVVQGERDPFGGPSEFPPDLEAEVVEIPDGDHSLKVRKRAPISQEEATALVQASVLEWLERMPPRP